MDKTVIFTLIIVSLIAVTIYFLIMKILKKIQRNLHEISNIADTVSDVISLVKEADKVVATQPKTLSVVESVFLDDLKKDFPELNLDITKSFVQEIITDFLDFCHTGNDAELRKDCTENFIAQAKTFHLEDKISDLKFHKTVIKSYKKDADDAVITFQSSCQYILNDKMIQKRFEVDYIFYLEDTPLSKTVSMRCPHCGGPITHTGQKVCEFCDSKLIDTIKRTWKFNSIKEF